jgi:hypothetical protein
MIPFTKDFVDQFRAERDPDGFPVYVPVLELGDMGTGTDFPIWWEGGPYPDTGIPCDFIGWQTMLFGANATVSGEYEDAFKAELINLGLDIKYVLRSFNNKLSCEERVFIFNGMMRRMGYTEVFEI